MCRIDYHDVLLISSSPTCDSMGSDNRKLDEFCSAADQTLVPRQAVLKLFLSYNSSSWVLAANSRVTFPCCLTRAALVKLHYQVLHTSVLILNYCNQLPHGTIRQPILNI